MVKQILKVKEKQVIFMEEEGNMSDSKSRLIIIIITQILGLVVLIKGLVSYPISPKYLNTGYLILVINLGFIIRLYLNIRKDE